MNRWAAATVMFAMVAAIAAEVMRLARVVRTELERRQKWERGVGERLRVLEAVRAAAPAPPAEQLAQVSTVAESVAPPALEPAPIEPPAPAPSARGPEGTLVSFAAPPMPAELRAALAEDLCPPTRAGSPAPPSPVVVALEGIDAEGLPPKRRAPHRPPQSTRPPAPSRAELPPPPVSRRGLFQAPPRRASPSAPTLPPPVPVPATPPPPPVAPGAAGDDPLEDMKTTQLNLAAIVAAVEGTPPAPAPDADGAERPSDVEFTKVLTRPPELKAGTPKQ
jgi:hypothetical protein